MFNVANSLESSPLQANRGVIAASSFLGRGSGIARTQNEHGSPTAIVYRRSAGVISEPSQTPHDSVALRFFFGRCELYVDVGPQWHGCGEATDGAVHVSRPNQRVRSEWFSEGEEMLLIVPHGYWRERVTDGMRATLAKGRLRKHADPALQQLVKMFVQSAREETHASFASSLIDTLLARVIALYASHKNPKSHRCHRNALPCFRIRRVANYVREHLSEPITLRDMADAAGMSPMHFAALFRSATGQRPHHYLLEQRVLHARELMLRTTWSLCEIALSAGFSTQAHFSTVFKRFVGATPKQWRYSHMQ